MTSYLLGNMVFSARLAFLPALSLSKCRMIFLICGFSLRYFKRAAGVVLSSILSLGRYTPARETRLSFRQSLPAIFSSVA